MLNLSSTDPTKGRESLLPKPVTVFNREDKRLHHLGLDEVVIELIQLIQPKLPTVEVAIW